MGKVCKEPTHQGFKDYYYYFGKALKESRDKRTVEQSTVGLIWAENTAIVCGLHGQLYKNNLAQLGAAPKRQDAEMQTSTNSTALLLNTLPPAVTRTYSRGWSIKRRKAVGQKSIHSAERIHTCLLFLCVQWQELVPQERLFPTEQEPKLTPKDD